MASSPTVPSTGPTSRPSQTDGQSCAQRVIVIRHGERLDNVDYSWAETASRQYDPPITEAGVAQANEAAKKFVDKEIKYVIVSPFLRCLQTGQQISTVLSLPGLHTCNSIVDVLNGHCGIHEQPVVPASDVGELGIKIIDQDTSKLPRFPERSREAIKRFSPAYSRLAEIYWPHNIVIVTHGYGVQEAVVKGGGSGNTWINYCGYVELCRSSRGSEEWTISEHGSIDDYF